MMMLIAAAVTAVQPGAAIEPDCQMPACSTSSTGNVKMGKGEHDMHARHARSNQPE